MGEVHWAGARVGYAAVFRGLHERARRVLWLDGALVGRPCDGRAVRDYVPCDQHLRYGSRAICPAGPSRHREALCERRIFHGCNAESCRRLDIPEARWEGREYQWHRSQQPIERRSTVRTTQWYVFMPRFLSDLIVITELAVLMADPNWNNGFYYDGLPPHIGLKLARRKPRSNLYIALVPKLRAFSEIATITYRSGPEWDIRFGRKLRESPETVGTRTPALCPDFLIETYLDHQARAPSFPSA